MPTPQKLAYVPGVVAFVETDVLMSAAGGLGTLDRNAVESRVKKFDVVRVRAAYLYAQRHAATIGEHRSFGSQLAAIGRVFPGFFPRPEATWSSLRPRFANSTECLSVRRTPTTRLSTICGRRLLPSILESNDAKCCRTQTLLAPPSTGNPFAIHRRYRRQPSSSRYAADRPWNSSDSVATTNSSAAKVHREDTRHTASIVLPLETPPCWHKMSDKSLSVRRREVNSSVLG